MEEKLERVDWAIETAQLAKTDPGGRAFAASLVFDEGNLGNRLLTARRFERAAVLLTSAAENESADEIRAYWLASLGEAHRNRGAYLSYLSVVQDLEEIFQVQSTHALRVVHSQQYCSFLITLGLPDLASEVFRPSLHEAENAWLRGEGAPERLASMRVTWIQVLQAQDLHEEAVESVEGYFEDEELAYPNSLRAQLEILAAVSQLDLAMNRRTPFDDGLSLIKAALGNADPHMSRYALGILAKFEVLAGRLELAAEHIEAAMVGVDPALQPGLGLTLSRSQLAMARGSGKMQLEGLRTEIENELKRMIKQWSSVPELHHGIGFLLYPARRAILGEYFKLCIKLDPERGPEAALAILFEVETLSTLARRKQSKPSTLAEVRGELLLKRHGILVFLTADFVSHVFAVDARGVVHAELGHSDHIERAIGRYQGHLRSAQSVTEDEVLRTWQVEEERALAKLVAQELLPAPIRARMRTWERVTILGSDILGAVPFEWLPDEDEPYMGTRLAIDYLPSTLLGLRWAREKAERPLARGALLVGDVEPGHAARTEWPQFKRVPLDPSLERAVRKEFPSAHVEILRGAAATSKGLRTALMEPVGVMQMIVHGVRASSKDPYLPLLASESGSTGLLQLEDVSDMLPPRLVVQTYCQSGRGPRRRGDPGVREMSAAWLEAGAWAVVQTPDDLTLGDVRRDTPLLYERLTAGDSPAEALRALRRAAVARAGKRAPLESCRFQVQGLGQQRVFDPNEVGRK